MSALGTANAPIPSRKACSAGCGVSGQCPRSPPSGTCFRSSPSRSPGTPAQRHRRVVPVACAAHSLSVPGDIMPGVTTNELSEGPLTFIAELDCAALPHALHGRQFRQAQVRLAISWRPSPLPFAVTTATCGNDDSRWRARRASDRGGCSTGTVAITSAFRMRLPAEVEVQWNWNGPDRC